MSIWAYSCCSFTVFHDKFEIKSVESEHQLIQSLHQGRALQWNFVSLVTKWNLSPSETCNLSAAKWRVKRGNSVHSWRFLCGATCTVESEPAVQQKRTVWLDEHCRNCDSGLRESVSRKAGAKSYAKIDKSPVSWFGTEGKRQQESGSQELRQDWQISSRQISCACNQ